MTKIIQKLSLIFPPPSPEYTQINFGYESINTAPQTAHAVLAAYVEQFANIKVDIKTVSDQEVFDVNTVPPRYRNRTIPQLVDLCNDSDLVGVTCSFHNQETALELAKAVKESNPNAKIVFGAQNVSSLRMAKMILEQYPEVDYIVRRDGAKALALLVNGAAEETIPNLVYRDPDQEIKSTRLSYDDLNTIPVWDFRHLLDRRNILEVYDSRTKTYRETQALFQGLMPRIGVYSLRGCIKAVQGVNGGSKGPCSYCTTGETTLRTLDPFRFWKQIAHLYHEEGLQDFFIADDVFAISPDYVKAMVDAKKKCAGLPQDLNFRAYAYPTTFSVEKAEEMASNLKEIGVNNIFLGVETFDERVSIRANKDCFSYPEVAAALALLRRYKIDSAIPFMPGLPGETIESLDTSYTLLDRLLQDFGTRELGKGGLTRVDISAAVPLIGTAWYAHLVSDPIINRIYAQKTGRKLQRDVNPKYEVLREIAAEQASLPPALLREHVAMMVDLCNNSLRRELVGGFNLQTTPQD